MKKSLVALVRSVLDKTVSLKKSPELLPQAVLAHAAASKAYYETGESPFTDEEFDLFEKRIKLADPEWKPPVGAKVNKKVERELVVPCASLDKIQADNAKALARYVGKLRRNERVRIEAKIDGASLLAHYPNYGRLSSLSTRGSGILGKSVDGFIEVASRPFEAKGAGGLVTDLRLTKPTEIALRFEVIMPEKTYKKKYADKFDSARVMSSAVFNRSVPDPAIIRDLHFVLIEGWMREGKEMVALSPASLDTLAFSCGMHRPQSAVLTARELEAEALSDILSAFRSENIYYLDGLVLRPEDISRERHPTGENPEFVKAFKVNDIDSAMVTTIEKIVWKVSSHGRLVPKAQIAPVMFGNVKVVNAALHNVDWATERGAGVGAKVRVIRSGEIIPKIVQVDKPALFKLPSKKVYGDYKKDGVHLVLTDAQDPVVSARKIGRMFGILGMDQLGGSLATKMVEAGFDTTAKVTLMTPDDVAVLPGIKSSAKKICAQIARFEQGEFDICQLFIASGVADAGIGDRVMKKIAAHCPEQLTALVKRQDILRLTEAVGPAAASTVAAAWPAFREWMREVRPVVKAIEKPRKTVKGVLNGQCFSWTGYRDKAEEAYVLQNGGEIVPFGKRTTVLFYRSNGKASGKVAAAGSRAKQFAAWKSGGHK